MLRLRSVNPKKHQETGSSEFESVNKWFEKRFFTSDVSEKTGGKRSHLVFHVKVANGAQLGFAEGFVLWIQRCGIEIDQSSKLLPLA